jgi:Fic family protein
MFNQVEVALPPLLADARYETSSEVMALMEDAAREIVATDQGAGGDLAALGRFLIQTESVASSKIERVEASSEDFARALAGVRSNASASSMVAATAGLTEMVAAAGAGRIELGPVLVAHEILMRGDPLDAEYAGRVRDMQNWIGGSDHSPLGAVHVPPPPETVEPYLDDLLVFANRDDVPAIAQAAIVHAQFESIHPFTDGNGRIGRALINSVLRRRKLTTATVVPVASAMSAQRQRYFDFVNDYRFGRLGPFVVDLARCAIIAAEESRESATRLRLMPEEWRELSKHRRGSTGDAILSHLLANPVLTADAAERLGGSTPKTVYAALDKLEDDGVVHEITGRKRDRVWAATSVMAEVDDLGRRIGKRVTE